MKVYPDRLDADLAKSLRPVYLLSGDDTLLINEAADSIRSACRAQGFTERELFFTDTPGFDWEQVIQSLNSMSLFSDRTIVEVRCNKQKPNHKALQEYLAAPSPDSILILISPKLDGSAQRTKWFKAIDKSGAFIPVWPIEGSKLTQWLQQRCKSHGLNLSSSAISILQDHSEGNLLAASQEIEKLKLLYGDASIDEEQIINAVTDNARYNVFQLSDTALSGNAAETMQILSSLKNEGVAEQLLLWALTRELRILLAAKEAIQNGEQANWALKQQGVWEQRQPLFKTALGRMPISRIQDCLKKAAQIDLSIKGLSTKDAWLSLQDLYLMFSEKKHN